MIDKAADSPYHNSMRRILIGSVIVLLFAGYLIPVIAKTNEEIYQEKSARLKPDNAEEHYQLGLWCLKNKLADEAQAEFNKAIELNPNHDGARKRLGHTKYKDEWLTPSEMKAQGLAKYKDKWIPKEKYEKLWLQGDKLIQLEPPNGSIGRPGADNEKLAWENARQKETGHFIVKTNLSFDALQDIGFIMECAFLKWQEICSLSEIKEKPFVWVCKNREDFERVYKEIMGKPIAATDHGSYLSKDSEGNSLREDVILNPYPSYEIRKKTDKMA
jgi:tetratricopeptide (TPR) repeat protein